MDNITKDRKIELCIDVDVQNNIFTQEQAEQFYSKLSNQKLNKIYTEYYGE